ncbi:MAG: bacterial Ig-like domain-containing protein [Bacteroidales bacterium]
MNKIIKRLFTPLAVFTMAIGLGVAVNNQKDFVGARAAPTTVTVVRDDFSGGSGYANGTWSKGGIDGEGVIYFDAKAYIQVSTTSGRQPYPHNTTATPGPITNISVTMPGSGSLRSLTPRVSSTAAVTSHTGGTALTAQTFTTNTQTLNWTIPSADNIRYFQLVPGGNTNWASFSFTYEEVSQEFGLLDHITLDTANAKLNYYVGDAFNLSGLSVTAYDTVGFTKILSSGYTSDYDGYTFSQGDIGTKLVTVSYTEGEVTVTETFSINVAAAPVLQKFSKVTSLSQLHLGAQYVIAGTKSDVVWVMSTIQGSNNRTAIEATMDGSDIVETDQTQMFLLEEGSVDNTFAFKSINGDTSNQYIYSASSSKNYLRSQATIDGNASWRIGIDSGVISMISQGSNTRNVLMLNSSSALFASYNGGQNAIDLYVDLTSIVSDDYTAARDFADDVVNGEGLNAKNNCEVVHASLMTKYNALSEGAKEVFEENAEAIFVSARARMDYLAAWVGANETPAGRITSKQPSNNLAAIALIGVIGITTLVGYYFINKKRLTA